MPKHLQINYPVTSQVSSFLFKKTFLWQLNANRSNSGGYGIYSQLYSMNQGSARRGMAHLDQTQGAWYSRSAKTFALVKLYITG